MPILLIIIAATIIILLSSSKGLSQGLQVLDMSTLQKIHDDWYDLASNWAEANGNLSTEEILAIIANESSGDPNQVNPTDPSYGLMGVDKLIGTAYGNITDIQELFNPATNIKSGSTFLSFLKRKYAASFPLGGVNGGWVQMYNEGETSFLKGHRAHTYEQNFITHYNAMVQITNANSNSQLGGS